MTRSAIWSPPRKQIFTTPWYWVHVQGMDRCPRGHKRQASSTNNGVDTCFALGWHLWTNVVVQKQHCHLTESHAAKDETVQIETKWRWYQWHRDEVLDYWYQFLVHFASEDIGRWLQATRLTKLELLNNTCSYYEVECDQKEHRQSTIYDLIHLYTVLRNVCIIRGVLADS